MSELLSTSVGLLIASFASIISIANPFSAMPVFTALTSHNTNRERASIAKKTAIYMVIILTIFLLAGTAIKNFFGISLAGIRVAGGLIIMQAAWGMLKTDSDPKEVEKKHSNVAKKDVSFSPLAMPLMAGPGSISVVIGMASNSNTALDFVVVIIAIILSAVISYFVLRLGPISSRYIGPNGMNAITSMMGFIVMAIAIQFILSGVKEFFAL